MGYSPLHTAAKCPALIAVSRLIVLQGLVRYKSCTLQPNVVMCIILVNHVYFSQGLLCFTREKSNGYPNVL